MKKILVVAAVAMMVIVVAGVAFAASEVSVSATVTEKCGAVGAGSIANFAIDPDNLAITKNTSDLGNTSPKVKCTKGSTVLVTCTADNGGVLSDGVDIAGDIPFSVSCPGSYGPAAGFGGAGDAIDVSISLLANAAQNASATAHTGSVTVTVGF